MAQFSELMMYHDSPHRVNTRSAPKFPPYVSGYFHFAELARFGGFVNVAHSAFSIQVRQLIGLPDKGIFVLSQEAVTS